MALGSLAGRALGRLFDEELVKLDERGSGTREAAIGQHDEYVDWRGEAAIQKGERDPE